ncbi:phage tail tape measure protein [Phocoenobacter skyensis]|uniref:phage tail tape measure protein n=1 Tax=Phocoenobacter skyensis TaxID=97481 RepID=UPI0027938199|nr:phage tail tape measure protein [Pasteurella skyensis]MDP8162801.1 phage tail tape measure protein [Pasteurella skyensis]
MATELAIAIKVGATVGAALGGLTSLGKSISGLSKLTSELENDQVSLGRAIQRYSILSDNSIGGLKKRYDKLGTTIDKLKAKQLSLNKSLLRRDQLTNQRNELKGKLLDTAAIAITAGMPVKLAMDFESSMADVKKVVNFETPQQFKEMEKDILNLTHSIPMAGDEIAAIVAAGGQAGIARENLIGYATDAAKMGVAFDMAAGDAGTAMATMANVLGKPISEMAKFGDAINHLSDNANAKARDIVEVIARSGSDAKMLGLTENQTAALGSTFLSMGKAPQLAAQAIKGMSASFADLKAGKHAKELKMLGLTPKSFANAMNKDAQGAISDFIKRVKQLPKDDQYPALSKMFGREYADDLLLLAQNTGEYNRQLKLLQETDENGNLKYVGSMVKEFQNRSSTSANNLTLLKNSVVEFCIRAGSVLLPTFNELVNEIKPVIYATTDWIETHPKLTKGIMMVATGLATLKVVSLGTQIGFNVLKTLGNESFIVANKMSAGWLKANIQLGRTKMATTFASSGFKGLTRSIIASGAAFVASPIGLVIAGITVAGLALYKFWKPIKSFFIGFFDGVSQAVKPLKPLIDGVSFALGSIWDFLSPIVSPVLDFFGNLFSLEQVAEGGAKELGQAFGVYIGNAINSVVGFVQNMWTSISTFFNSGIENITKTIINWSPLGLFYKAFQGVLSWFGIDLPKQFTEFGANIISGLVDGISNAWNSAKETVTELGNSVSDWFAEKLGIHSPSRVFMGFGENTVQGLAIGIDKNLNLAKQSSDNLSEAVTLDHNFAKNEPEATPSLFADYQPLNRNTVTNNETHKNSGMTVHFNPTINVNGNGNQGVVEQVQQGLKMSLQEFEQMLRRVQDHQQWRAY